MNEKYSQLAGKSIVILKTAVRGVHVYNIEPEIGTLLTLTVEKGSKYNHAVLVKSNGKTVGHVAKEHARLVTKWIKSSNKPSVSLSYYYSAIKQMIFCEVP